MATDNWNQVKEILERAIETPPEQRETFLASKCSGDPVLRSRIDSLIDSYDRIGSFMEDGAIGGVAEMFSSSKNGLQPGDQLGRYRIVRILGEGGMGKVYLADDLDLHRQVAVKVLRDDLWWYKQARQRLLREARAAAKLDHPNICSIFEIIDTDERSFIVMQYVEGRTLGEMMAIGDLSLRSSLDIASQIASALEEAHSHHIVHRDIKPANIIVNEKRQAKVLDFGLAKSIEAEPTDEEKDLSSSGAIMGTVPYMSPEQLRGKNVDERSDIFSFGAVFFEMITGRQVFGTENNAETIAAILNDEPDLSIIPSRFRPIIERALMKRADDRYQSISELAEHLRDVAGDLVDDGSELSRPSRWFVPGKVISTAFRRYFPNITGGTGIPRSFYRWQDSDSDARTVLLTEPLPSGEPTGRQVAYRNKIPVWLTAGALLVLAGIPAAFFWFSRSPVQTRSSEPLRPVRLASWKDAASTIYLGYSSSHSGKMLAYAAAQEGPNEAIRVKQIDDGGDVPVTRDNWKNYSPIWSPDDQQVAFVSLRDGSYGVYSTSFLGGEPKLIKPLEDGSISLRHWSNDSSAIYYEFNGNLFRLDLASRDAAQITSFEPSRSTERYFAFSRDESKIAYCDRINGQSDLLVMPAVGGEPRNLTNDADIEDHPSWYPDGNRIAYSVRRGEHTQIQIAYLDGQPGEEVTRGEGEYQLIDVSADGKHIFYTTWEDRSDIWSVNVDSGQETQVAAEKESEFWPDISPDGRSIVYQTNSAQNPLSSLTESTIVVRSIDDVQQSRHLVGYDPRWLPDSRHVAFLRWQGPEKRNALWTVDSVTGEEKMAIDGGINTPDQAALPYDRFQTSEFSWSPDASAVVCTSRNAGILNVNVIDVERSTFAPITQNTDSSVRFYSPLFSADGKRLAYLSVEKSQGKKEGSISRLLVSEDGNLKEVFSTANGLRLLGWTGSQSIVWGVIDGRLRGGLNDMRLIKKSINGQPEFESVLKDIYPTSVSLSPDGNSVAFTARRDDKDDIFTISIAATGVVKKVTSNNDPRIYLGSLTWSPDGRRIFFDKQERIKSISMF